MHRARGAVVFEDADVVDAVPRFTPIADPPHALSSRTRSLHRQNQRRNATQRRPESHDSLSGNLPSIWQCSTNVDSSAVTLPPGSLKRRAFSVSEKARPKDLGRGLRKDDASLEGVWCISDCQKLHGAAGMQNVRLSTVDVNMVSG
jgi:hypothetical protein